MDVIIYPYGELSQTILVKWAPDGREHIYVSFKLRYNRFHHQIAFDNVIFTTVVILSGHNVLKRTDDISRNCELNVEY